MRTSEITGQVIYLGPRVHDLGLGYSTVFRNGIHPSLHAAVEACPAIGQLMIPVHQASAVRRELNFDYGHTMRGTSGKYVTFYQEVQKWLAKRATQPKQPTTLIHHA